jgi:hypothetical protein
MRFKKGDKVECVESHSIAYTVGQSYEVTDKNGTLGIVGNDKLFDSLTLLVSKFKKIETKREQKPVDEKTSQQ